MKHIGEQITKHRNSLLMGLMVTTLVVSRLAKLKEARPVSVNIPVMQVTDQGLGAMAEFRQQREQSMLADIASLEALCAQVALDAKTREDAASLLTTIIAARRAQDAMEGALATSSLYPCTVVVEGGALTVVTEKTTITEKDSALVLTLAAAHTNVLPENVRIVTAQ